MADEAQNKQAMKEAIDTLNLIVSTNSTPKTIKKSVTDLIADLVKDDLPESTIRISSNGEFFKD